MKKACIDCNACFEGGFYRDRCDECNTKYNDEMDKKYPERVVFREMIENEIHEAFESLKKQRWGNNHEDD